MSGGVQTSGGMGTAGRKIGAITGSNLSYVAVAATFTAVSYANNGGNVQFSSAGVHGLTTSPAVGNRVYVSWSGGTGVNGFYTIATVDSTTAFTVTLTHAGGLGTPTVSLAGTNVTLTETVTLPANSLGLRRKLVLDVMATFVGSTNNKTMSLLFGSAAIAFLSTSSATAVGIIMAQSTWNDGATNVQKSTGGNGFGVMTSAFTSAAIDTTQDVTLSLRLNAAAANEPQKILRAQFYLW